MTTNNYVTLQDIKDAMPNNDVSSSNKWDAYATLLCTNLSRAFDLHTWREPGAYAVSTAVARLYDGIPPTATTYIDLLTVDEMADFPSAVSINGTPVPPGDYWGFPYNALQVGKPYTSLRLNPKGSTRTWGIDPRSISVTALFGYSKTAPPEVFQSLLLYAARFLRKAQQNYLETGTFLDSGQVLIMGKRDEDLAGIIERFRKPRVVGAGYYAT